MIWSWSAIIRQEWRHKSYRELFTQWQAFQIDVWHHTAQLRQSWLTKKVPYKKLHPYIGREIIKPDMRVKLEKQPTVFKVDPERVKYYRDRLDAL